jgi:hypothetical protein
MKTEYCNKPKKIEVKFNTSNHHKIEINNLPDRGISNLLKLDCIYETGDIEKNMRQEV